VLKITEKVLDQIAEKIVKEVDPVKIILFGSYSRGDARPDSDIDLLIVEDQPFSENKNRWNEMIRIRQAIKSIKHPKDILVYSVEEVEKWRHSLNHIISKCLNEGKVIYERY
jgi:predicted nucleotidyltransferase